MAAKKTSTKKVAQGHTSQAGAKRPAKTDRKMSQIEAAVKVLKQGKEPMTCKAMVAAMAKKGYWSSPAGRTPEATLYASILRDLKKGKSARFKKVDQGLFALK